MCPKSQIISLYHDKELPSPWKEKMETHLQECPECRAVLAKYVHLGEWLQAARGKAETEAQERVWKKITAPELLLPGPGTRREKEKRNWNITLPLPVAAAAVLVIIASLALVGISTVNRPAPQIPVATLEKPFEAQGIVSANDLNDINGVIQYLSDQSLGDFMVVRLPESPRFSRGGEPLLLNAADYSRRAVSR